VSSRLIEIELRVANVERSRRFYRDLIGIDVGDLESHSNEAETHAHATWGEWAAEPTLLMLNLYPAGAEAPTASRFGFAVPDLDSVDRRLREAGATVVRPPETRPWGRSAVYRDPDDNLVSLTEAPR
jgi:predicted enzyme related to lactoylglutathione lyase